MLEEVLMRVREIVEKEVEVNRITDLPPYEMIGVTASHYIYVNLIEKLGNPTFTEVANTLGVKKPTVTATVLKLMEKGFVEKRQSDVDKRVYYLSVTERGKKLIDAELSAYGKIVEKLRKVVSMDELRTIEKGLEKFADMYDKKEI